MDQVQYLHHYTTISALALLLKNRTIRFNRLDRVDDVRESHKYGEYYLSRYLYVSCWTDSDEENIPLWYMYSKGMTGVRLSLSVDPFEYRPLTPHPIWGGIVVQGQILSILPIEKMFGDEYMVNPTWFYNKENFIRKVEYVEEDDLVKMREQAVKLDLSANEQFMVKIAGPAKLAGYKSTTWAFQREVRYILMIFPTPHMPPSGPSNSTWIDNLTNHVINSIHEGIGPNINYFDIPIDQSALDNIKVTLAPLATEPDKIIVDALLKEYTKNGYSSKSNLTDLIRQPAN